MNHLYKSKWTSIEELYGWKHFEVLNIFKRKQEVEMICVCETDKKIMVPISDLKDESKWINGWNMLLKDR